MGSMCLIIRAVRTFKATILSTVLSLRRFGSLYIIHSWTPLAEYRAAMVATHLSHAARVVSPSGKRPPGPKAASFW